MELQQIRKTILGIKNYNICNSGGNISDIDITERVNYLKNFNITLSPDEIISLCKLKLDIGLTEANQIYYRENGENLTCNILRFNLADKKEFEKFQEYLDLQIEQKKYLGQYVLDPDYFRDYQKIKDYIVYLAIRDNGGDQFICGTASIKLFPGMVFISSLNSRTVSSSFYKGIGTSLINRIKNDFINDPNIFGMMLTSDPSAYDFYILKRFRSSSLLPLWLTYMFPQFYKLKIMPDFLFQTLADYGMLYPLLESYNNGKLNDTQIEKVETLMMKQSRNKI
jgi:hypothetical protein